MDRKRVRYVVAGIPLVLVNAIAFSGQLGFIRDHIHWPLAGQIAFAAALESIALFLAYAAHDALMQEDSALRLRLASYGVALLVGVLNYSHYAHGWDKPTFEAIGTALMSVISPWLWGVFSRRSSRDLLKAKGLIEGRSVRLGLARWLFWPIRSYRVYRLAAWTGEQNPHEAIAYAESPEVAAVATGSGFSEINTKAEAVRFAAGTLALADHGDLDAITASQVFRWLSDHSPELPAAGQGIPISYVADVLRRDRESRARNYRAQLALEQGSGHE